MKVMVQHSKGYRVFRLEDDEPYFLIRARDPFALRALGAVGDVLEEHGIHIIDFKQCCAAVVEWQAAHQELITFGVDFEDFELVKKEEATHDKSPTVGRTSADEKDSA